MSLLTMIQQSGNVVTRRVSATVFQWMLAVSNAVDNLIVTGGLEAQMRFVSKGGNDTTGTGSRALPFLTIQRAITSITDATATKPYTVEVGPGIYAETFAISPWVYVNGVDELDCVLTNVTANWITAGFAAGTQDAGLSNFTLRTPFTANFATVVAVGAATFTLSQIMLETGGTITFVGNVAANVANMQDIATKNASAGTYLTLTNINFYAANVNLRAGNVVISSTDAYTVLGRALGSFTSGSFSMTWTGAVTANFLTVLWEKAVFANGITIVGAGASLLYFDSFNVSAPDADTLFSFGSVNPAGAVILPQKARNYIRAIPTANRTFSFDPPRGIDTAVFLKNESAFFITLAFTNGALMTGGLSYIPPFGSLEMWGSGTNIWEVMTCPVQSGTVTLTNGVSALIPCDINTTVGADIVASLRDINGGTLGAMVSSKLAGRVAGTRAGGGGFVLTSVTAAGVTVATDNGIYDWYVNNG